jgi:peptidoglycan hydrolase-like protein with peptidoglycan-binding domain
MRKALYRKSLHYAILAALAAGGLTLPAAGAAQSASKKSANSTSTHKSAHARSSGTTKSVNSAVPASPSAKPAATKSRTSKSGKVSSRKNSRRVKGQATPTSDRINEIQEALQKRGAYAGTPTGKWDDDTVDSMKKFQSAHGLKPSGKLDAPTLQKLGLGSDTTGLGAPTPPPNSVANRLLSKNTASEPQE